MFVDGNVRFFILFLTEQGGVIQKSKKSLVLVGKSLQSEINKFQGWGVREAKCLIDYA